MAEPLFGEYLVRNSKANFILSAIDACLRLCVFFQSKNGEMPSVPRRILLANAAHMGDVLIATAVIPVLHDCFPESEIGFLVGSWALPVINNMPRIRRIHVLDHWKLDRVERPLWKKVFRYWQMRKAVLNEIRAEQYDVAIDLYFHFPNFIPLLWQTGIPIRIGYTSGGFGPLLTHKKEWKNLDQHVSAYHAALLRMLNIEAIHFLELHYALPVPDCNDVLRRATTNASGYVVVHMGTGERLREWPLEKWRALTELLVSQGYCLVFTGSGQREIENARFVTMGFSNCVNLCGEISWDEFICTVKKAQLVICVESLAAHIAAAVDTACVAIWSGIANHNHWQPLSKKSRVMLNPMPCAPCYQRRGCPSMDCVRNLEVNIVYQVVLKELINSVGCNND